MLKFAFKNVVLRRAVESDLSELVPLINEAYSYQDAAKGEPRTSSKKLKTRIEEVDFYVLTKEQKTIGCVYLEPKGKSLHFGLLTLAEAYRGEGIATALLKKIEEFAMRSGYERIELDYMSLAPWLEMYYKNQGFKLTGEITKWGSIDLVRMAKDLL